MPPLKEIGCCSAVNDTGTAIARLMSSTNTTTRQTSGEFCADSRQSRPTTPSNVESVKLVSRVIRSESAPQRILPPDRNSPLSPSIQAAKAGLKPMSTRYWFWCTLRSITVQAIAKITPNKAQKPRVVSATVYGVSTTASGRWGIWCPAGSGLGTPSGWSPRSSGRLRCTRKMRGMSTPGMRTAYIR